MNEVNELNGKRQIEILFDRYPKLDCCRDEVERAYEIMCTCYRRGNRVLVCGNGGSAADSLHIVGELVKSFVLPRKLSSDWKERFDAVCPEMTQYLMDNLQNALPTISLVSETALSTAYANDQAPDLCFAQQVLGQGKAGDVLLGITTSGNSANVLYAVAVARAIGISVVGLTGETGGKIKPMCDACICVPSRITHEIQEYHLPVYHALCLALEEEFFGKD